jgi:hypothetical protein
MSKPFLIAFAMAAAAFSGHAQTTVTMFGALANFDVLNDRGQETFGFQIELDGITPAQIGGTFIYNRYGSPTIMPFSGGVNVRYMAQWDSVRQAFTTGTPVAVNTTPTTGHQCVMGTLNYDISGCEHFGRLDV